MGNDSKDTTTNTTETYNFSGSIPQHYDQWLGPLYFEPYAVEVANRVEPSAVRIALEIACGTGRVTRHLRKVIPPAAKLIASDLSPDMLAIAKEKLKTENIDWQIIDAQDLPFDDNSIDLVVCCFGYMFVPDKPKAYAEVYRVLRTGAMLIISTWDQLEHNKASIVYRKAVKKWLDPLPEMYNLPFSMSDPVKIKEDFQRAGFSSVTIERIDRLSVSPTAAEAAYGLVQGGSIYNEIMQRNPAWIEQIRESVEKELTEKFGAAPMEAPMSALITIARK